ncbi:MAG: FAD-dependent oxidoreductase [Coriobacteriales bacterium]|nr:FAD-dependent oxidoreductase [Coriobacteriales bacterium]
MGELKSKGDTSTNHQGDDLTDWSNQNKQANQTKQSLQNRTQTDQGNQCCGQSNQTKQSLQNRTQTDQSNQCCDRTNQTNLNDKATLGVTRRDFLSGAAIGAAIGVAGVAMTGLAACAPSNTNNASAGASTTTTSGNTSGAAVLDTEKYPALADSRNPIDWLGTPPNIKPSDCKETVEADVVVIGAAVAGELAGYGAVKEGAKVVMLERNGTAHISGSGIGFSNSKYQIEQGLPEIDKYELFQRIFNQLEGRCDQGLLASWVWHSGAVLDELEEVVLQPAGLPGTASGELEGEGKNREILQNLASHVNFDDTGGDNLEVFNNVIHDWIEKNGGQIVYNTTARVLTQDDDGTVTGVIAQNKDGDYIYYKAATGVVVATGSYGGNEDMMRAFANPWLAEYAKNYGIYNARVTDTAPITTDEKMDDGTGHKMLCWAGAVMEQTDPSFQSWEGSGYWWWPFLHVDTTGKRFRNESSSWLDHTHLIAELPAGVNYYWQILPTNDFEMPSTLMPLPFRVWGENVNAHDEVYVADTIEELAEKIDVDPKVLRATVDRYNEICASGIDDDFCKQPKYLDPVDDPPYQAVKATINFYCTSSGVKIDRFCRVLDKDWNPIKNLFAAGNTVGWRLGSGYQMTVGGLCNGWAFFHGYVSGKVAANPNWSFEDIGK